MNIQFTGGILVRKLDWGDGNYDFKQDLANTSRSEELAEELAHEGYIAEPLSVSLPAEKPKSEIYYLLATGEDAVRLKQFSDQGRAYFDRYLALSGDKTDRGLAQASSYKDKSEMIGTEINKLKNEILEKAKAGNTDVPLDVLRRLNIDA